MLQILLAAHVKSDPTGIRDPGVFLGEALREQRIANGAREGNIDHPASVHVSDFGISENEFSAAEAVRMH